ncbi:MAG: sigma-54-dependent Fis family transcriptional regulator [Deltaproteobacteria bacterium]|nr:sigma-54-dependent Fis family transcriptional regulator [Deltaproteobacteria bacterium]
MKAQPYPEHPILLVDDDFRILNTLEIALLSEGFSNIKTVDDPREALKLILLEDFDAALLDIIMPGMSGQELLTKIREQRPELPVIMVSGVDDVATAVACLHNGAFDYILKPAKKDHLAASLRRALKVSNLKKENLRLANSLLDNSLKHPLAFSEIKTNDEKMINLFRYCEAVAPGSEPFLLTGETGTGKELFARVIHKLSGRKGAFVPVNIAGLDEQAFSDTLFGHQKGAFTGADRYRAGFMEAAAGGTIFLDEIGDLEPASQVKLLRVLEERKYYPLGSDIAKPLDARLVAATNQNLETLRDTEKFRKDFYFRIKTHHIHIPPLRERKTDLPLLLDNFLQLAAKEFNKKPPSFPQELLTLLQTHDWPGNIRELRALVYDAIGFHQKGMLALEVFEKYLFRGQPAPPGDTAPGAVPAASNPFEKVEKLPFLKECTQNLIEEALRRSNGNQRIAAGLLGITPQALNNRLRRGQK